METRASVAEWNEGRLTVWTGTQQPSRVQRDLCDAFRLSDDRVRTTIGPFRSGALSQLDRDDRELGLRRVLETVADSLSVEERDGGSWVALSKRTSG